VGLGSGVAAFALRFGEALTPYNRGYAIMSALLPLAFIAALAANRGYERRYLYVGTEEYQRVLRAGLVFTVTVTFVAYAFEIRLARGYVSIALPLVILACVAARFGLRKRLHRARNKGACLRRVVLVGHELAVVALTRQLRRERYHGLDVVGACLPAPGPTP
jgi:FlaA1/EpsC-like NDP-sugar epimerase